MRIIKSIWTCIAMLCVWCIALPAFSDAAVTPEVTTTIFDRLFDSLLGMFSALPAWAQIAVVIIGFLLTIIPHVAPFTPWTWDDKTIQYKTPITAFFLRLWNLAAGNWGKAANKSPGTW